jgi:hypothetical protein
MKPGTRRLLYIILVILVVPTFYSIFNIGNPKSLFRYIVPDPSYDILITIFLAVCMAAIGIILSQQSKRENSIEHMLDVNKEHIRFLKNKGKTDYAIADEFLQQMQVQQSGFLYQLAKRKVLKYLSKMD